jgi:hypothetical protein
MLALRAFGSHQLESKPLRPLSRVVWVTHHQRYPNGIVEEAATLAAKEPLGTILTFLLSARTRCGNFMVQEKGARWA